MLIKCKELPRSWVGHPEDSSASTSQAEPRLEAFETLESRAFLYIKTFGIKT